MSATREFLLERPNIFARALLYILFVIGISTTIFLWFAKINITVPGTGIITKQEEIREVYTPYEGVQKEIYVKKGELVKAKQVIAVVEIEKEYHSILSPIDGIVAFAKSWDEDIPLQNDVPAFIIVPTGNNIVAKFQVLSSKMKNIKLGQNVNLKIDAYPYRNFGVWESEIIYISATTTLNAAGENVYEVIAKVSKKDIENKEQKLIVGQSLTSEIIVDRKRVLSYLLDFILGVGLR